MVRLYFDHVVSKVFGYMDEMNHITQIAIKYGHRRMK